MSYRASALPKPDPPAVIARAVLSAAARLGLRHRQLAAVLGASEASVSRLQRGRGIEPASKEGELALLFLRLYRSLDALMGGDDERARRWLHAENVHLGGVPAERLNSVQGLVDVVQYLDAMRGKM
jgi:transcriptional regulator with XRE-family HTH domain